MMRFRVKSAKLFIAFFLLMASLMVIWLLPELSQQSLINLLNSDEPSTALLYKALFVVMFALGTLVFMPGSLFSLAGGALFGPWWGMLVNLLGASLGSSLAFLIGRYLAGDGLQNRLQGKGKTLMDGVNAQGWRFVAFVRLVPLFPFNVLNYALGLTRIPFKEYVVTSFITMAPGSLAFSYLGHAGRNLADGGTGALQPLFIALSLLGVTLVLPRIIKAFGKNKAAINPG